MKFKDMATALAMRDWAERVATGVVTRMRPAPIMGEVTSVDMLTRTATIRTAGQGDDEPDIRVNYMPHLAPNQVKTSVFSGNIVEASGDRGNMYITKIFSGLYCDEFGAPSGMRADFSGLLLPPPGWLLENGQAISRTQYFRLFAKYGTMYGAGDGSTTFNIDNTMGRISVGYDPLQTEFDSLVDKGGNKTKALSANEGPVHSHPFTGGHSWSWGGAPGGAPVYAANAIATAGNPPSNNLTTSQGVFVGTQNSGGGASFSIMNPYYVSLKCVKI